MSNIITLSPNIGKFTWTKVFARSLSSSTRWPYEAKEISSLNVNLMTTSKSASRKIEERSSSWAKSKLSLLPIYQKLWMLNWVTQWKKYVFQCIYYVYTNLMVEIIIFVKLFVTILSLYLKVAWCNFSLNF